MTYDPAWTGTLRLTPDGKLSGGIRDRLGWTVELAGVPDTDEQGVTRWRMSGDVVIPDCDKLPWEEDE